MRLLRAVPLRTLVACFTFTPFRFSPPGRGLSTCLDIRPRVVPCRVLHVTRASKIVDSARQRSPEHMRSPHPVCILGAFLPSVPSRDSETRIR